MTTIYTGGRFFIGAPGEHNEEPFAPCMIVKNDLIDYVGGENDDHVQKAKGEEGVSIVDMNNQVVVPGFIDGHMHLLLLASALKRVNLESCKNLEDIRSTIKSYAVANPTAPRILCRGWMHPMTNGVALASTLDDLDDRPIFIDSKDLHSTWCNTAALKELGIESTPNPAGGEIFRDESGKPSGLVSESAAQIYVWPHIAKVTPMADKVAAMKDAIKAYTACGYTGMIEMATDDNIWEALQLLRSQENLPFRLAAYWLIKPSDSEADCLAQVDHAISLQKRFNEETSPDCRVTGIKVICDGVVDACTASLLEPYSSNGDSPDPLWDPKILEAVVRRADSAGLQCALHAIGDKAVKLAIDTLEKVCGDPSSPTAGKLRPRIEHLELTTEEDAKRLGKLGITASIQPVHADPAICGAWPTLIGNHRCGRAFAYKEFQDGGAPIALGTDSPTAPFDPLPNLYIATTRRSARKPESVETVNKHAALSLASSVAAASTGTAYSCFADKRTGSLRAGLKADFAVLKTEWKPENFLSARVSQTWFDGKKVYDAEG
ncbi:hypothetical protein FQN54_008890 [Arachnomyces sp. PD_36]|nr:hypothetical protein FQN54_008890 [Arachnomyces sp. PD_36]